MEKEIKLRKKRFAAFCLAVVLICGAMLPFTARAEAYNISYTEDGLSGLPADNILKAGDTITYGSVSESEKTYSVQYYDHLNENSLFEAADTVSFGQQYTVKSPASLPDNADFEGWYYDSVSGSGGVLYSIRLYAKISYKITYVPADSQGSNPDSYVYGTGVAEDSLAGAEKIGHSFGGWYSDESFATEVKSISATQSGPITLYAKFTPETYNITYELNGGENGTGNPTSYTYGIGVPRFADAVKNDYVFDGWYSDSDFVNKVESISETQMAPITLYAKFTSGSTVVPGTPVSNVIELGTHELEAGVEYRLGSGVSKVNGDSSVYTSESTFYVPYTGTYTFE